MNTRTNIALNDDLHRQAKVRAAEMGINLKDAIDTAVRLWLATTKKPKR